MPLKNDWLSDYLHTGYLPNDINIDFDENTYIKKQIIVYRGVALLKAEFETLQQTKTYVPRNKVSSWSFSKDHAEKFALNQTQKRTGYSLKNKTRIIPTLFVANTSENDFIDIHKLVQFNAYESEEECIGVGIIILDKIVEI